MLHIDAPLFVKPWILPTSERLVIGYQLAKKLAEMLFISENETKANGDTVFILYQWE